MLPQLGQFLAGNRFAEGKATKLSSAWTGRHEEVLKVHFLRTVVVILAAQKIILEDTRESIMKLPDTQHADILERVSTGQAKFWVLREGISHSKIYLLSSDNGRKRVIVGSANLSEQPSRAGSRKP